MSQDFDLVCPVPISDYSHILLAHGGGGKLTHQLIKNLFLPAFKNEMLEAQHDGAVFNLGNIRLAFTTDSYVVSPLFFPGGDIGHLAVNGTVNDLAMCGARPLYLSAGIILEEGLPMEILCRVVDSMQKAATTAGVKLVTGDTKVVERGKADSMFINTSGIGILEHNLKIAPHQVVPNDVILLNGDIGRHGIAIMATREGLEFESEIESDTAPIADLAMQMIRAGIEIHCMRDLTRGGLASGVVEIAESAGVEIDMDESSIPIREDVQGACEILGFDPIYVANEGRFIAFVKPADAQKALDIMRGHPLGADACRIGVVTKTSKSGRVNMTSKIGATRIVDMISGEQLPRIC